MSVQALFGLSVLLSFVAFGIIAKLYIVPKLRAKHRQDAVLPLVVLHTFRFVGLSFLVPGVVSPSLSPAFAAPAAYGDLIATILAITATFALLARARWAVAVVWLFNTWGTGDLLYAFYAGFVSFGGDPGRNFLAPSPAEKFRVSLTLIKNGSLSWLLSFGFVSDPSGPPSFGDRKRSPAQMTPSRIRSPLSRSIALFDGGSAMARSWLKVSEFDKLCDDRRRRNRSLEADNAVRATPSNFPAAFS
jgi:hypothetical protein